MISVFLSVLSALFVATACYSAGKLVTRDRSFPWPVQMVLGMAILSSAFFVLLALGWGKPSILVATGVATIAACAMAGRLRISRPSLDFPIWTTLLLGIYGAFYLTHALTPEISYDGSGYHLGLVAEWLRTGGFPKRIGFYELLPQGVETLYALALAFHFDSVAPKLVHFLCLIGTVALLPSLGKKMQLPPWSAPAAALVYVACPTVGFSATAAYTDVAFVLATLATLFMVMEMWEEHAAGPWLLVGIVAGFCYSVKVPGLLVPTAVAVLLLARRDWRTMTGFVAGAAVTVLPWMGRSLVLTGNPLAPMMNTLFPNNFFSTETDSYLRAVFQFVNQSGLREINIPLELAFHGSRMGLMGPLVLAAPLGVLALWKKQTRPIAIAGCVLFGIYTLNLSARFLLPSFLFMIFALMAIVPRRIAHTLAVLAALACWPPVAKLYSEHGVNLDHWPYRAALGIESQQEYLRRMMPIYGYAEFAREHIPPGSRVFDCAGLPSFYSGAVTQQFWQTTELWALYKLLLDGLPKNTRGEVGREFARHDMRYITIPAGPAAGVPWAANLMKEAGEWGFRLVGVVGDNQLYEVR